MKRYKHLPQRDIFEAFNRIRDAFLAAKDGDEVDKIISFLLTSEEKVKIGRRIIVAGFLKSGLSYAEICEALRVGKATVSSVIRQLDNHSEGFELIRKRGKKVEDEYQRKKFREIGGSKLVFKRKEYTGFKRKEVKR